MSWIKTGSPNTLSGEVGAPGIPPDDAIIGHILGRGLAGGVSPKIDRGSQRPIIMPGRLATVDDGAVAHRQPGARVTETRRRLVEEQGAHLGAGHAQGNAAKLDRLAARGVALVRGQIGVAGEEQDAVGRNVEFLGGDLQHRGQHALADLDLAGRDRDPPALGEPHPLIEARIGGQRCRQYRWCDKAHRELPSSIRAAMRPIARKVAASPVTLRRVRRIILPASGC